MGLKISEYFKYTFFYFTTDLTFITGINEQISVVTLWVPSFLFYLFHEKKKSFVVFKKAALETECSLSL